MNIRTLETVIALARLESFSAAATHLGISQAAVSMRIAALEAELGRELFVRSRSGVRLTQTGVIFVDGARRVVAAYQQTLRSCGIGVRQSEFRVGILTSLGDIITTSVIRTLAERDPQMAINVETGSTAMLLDRLQAGELEMVFGVDHQQRAGLRSDFLCSLDMEWMQSASLPRPEADRPITPREIARQTVLTYRRNSSIHHAIVDYLRVDELARTQFIHCDNVPTMLQLTREGIGIALMSRMLAHREIGEGRIVVVPAAPPPPPLRYRAYASSHIDPRLYQAMIAATQKAIKSGASMPAVHHGPS